MHTLPPPQATRLLGEHSGEFDAYIAAAEDYVRQIGVDEQSRPNKWLYQKPFYQSDERRQYYMAMFQVLNLLQTIDLPREATIAEVGSGPGWITEILVSLGFKVECIEPCEDMIRVAKDRIASRLQHHRLEHNTSNVRFHASSLEASQLTPGTVDAFLFYESLHHVVDEKLGLQKCWQALKEGGVIAITGEAVWSPGDHNLEQHCHEEMARYGTLENPFTVEYLDYILEDNGFESITRYHSFNGFVPQEQGHRTVAELAQLRAEHQQNVIASKPWLQPTTASASPTQVGGSVSIKSKGWASDGIVDLTLTLENTGEAVWLKNANQIGQVTISLFRDVAGERQEIARHAISQPIRPGESVEQQCRFHLARDTASDLSFGMLAEHRFWFERIDAPHGINLAE